MSDQVVHDINSSIQALLNAMEITRDEWRTNPALVDKILPLTLEKINELKIHLERYKNLNLD